jgi:hypothetical protein
MQFLTIHSFSLPYQGHGFINCLAIVSYWFDTRGQRVSVLLEYRYTYTSTCFVYIVHNRWQCNCLEQTLSTPVSQTQRAAESVKSVGRILPSCGLWRSTIWYTKLYDVTSLMIVKAVKTPFHMVLILFLNCIYIRVRLILCESLPFFYKTAVTKKYICSYEFAINTKRNAFQIHKWHPKSISSRRYLWFSFRRSRVQVSVWRPTLLAVKQLPR